MIVKQRVSICRLFVSSDDEVSPLGNKSIADYLVGSSKREPSANLSTEDEEVASPSGQNFREFVLPRI